MAKRARKKAAKKSKARTKARTRKSPKKRSAVAKQRRKAPARKKSKPVARKKRAARTIGAPRPQGILARVEGAIRAVVDTFTDAEHLHQKLDPGVSREPE